MVSFSYLELTPSLEFFKSKFLCTLHVKMAKILDDQGTRIVFMHDLGTVESAYLRLFNSFSHAKLNKLRLKTVFVPHQDSRSSGLYSLSFHFSLCLPLVHWSPFIRRKTRPPRLLFAFQQSLRLPSGLILLASSTMKLPKIIAKLMPSTVMLVSSFSCYLDASKNVLGFVHHGKTDP